LVKHFISSSIHLLDQASLFNQIHTLFHPYLAISFVFLIEMKNLWWKKITFTWWKVDIYFEMVQFGTTVPKKKDWFVVDGTPCVNMMGELGSSGMISLPHGSLVLTFLRQLPIGHQPINHKISPLGLALRAFLTKDFSILLECFNILIGPNSIHHKV